MTAARSPLSRRGLRPAAKLAAWSVVGELALHPEASAEVRLREGVRRADAAVERLSSNWPEGLIRPCSMLAAVWLEGTTALVAHVGTCGVARLEGERIVPITTAHVLGTEQPGLPLAVARLPTRAVGRGGEPGLQRIPVEAGDVLLLATAPWPADLVHAELGLEVLAAGLARHGAATVIAARVGERATRPPVPGCTPQPPTLPWLFAPGRPLADPPPRYAPGTVSDGPDTRWFSEVFDGVIG